MSHLEDKALAKKVVSGDRAALREFFDRHYGPAMRYALRTVSSHDADLGPKIEDGHSDLSQNSLA